MANKMAKLRPADDLLLGAVKKTIAKLDPDETDAAAVKLAEQYAAVIDRAEQAVLDAEDALNAVDPADITARQYVTRLASKVEAQTVMAEIGPKLLAVLIELVATPAARAKSKGGMPSAAANRLAAIREARRPN